MSTASTKGAIVGARSPYDRVVEGHVLETAVHVGGYSRWGPRAPMEGPYNDLRHELGAAVPCTRRP
jgi:hypothetical protein